MTKVPTFNNEHRGACRDAMPRDAKSQKELLRRQRCRDVFLPS